MRITPLCIGLGVAGALAFLAAGGVGCDNGTSSGVSYAYEDPYLYSYYYPADVGYSSYYWASSWDYGDLYLATITGADGGAVAPDGGASGAGGSGGSGGSNSAMSARGAVGQIIRALARGEQVCTGQSTITLKNAPPPCTAEGVNAVRTGATIMLNGCQLPAGGTLSGTVDITSNYAANEAACSPNTTITLGHTTTITNLVYTSPAGGQIVIPTQMDTGSNNFSFGQNPTTITIMSQGQLQFFNASGAKTADLNHTGTRMFKFAGSRSAYTVNGTVNVTDNMNAGVTAMLTAMGLQRTTDCCRPTGGTLTIARTGGAFPGTHTWTFTSTCGGVKRDNTSVTLPACL